MLVANLPTLMHNKADCLFKNVDTELRKAANLENLVKVTRTLLAIAKSLWNVPVTDNKVNENRKI